MRRSSFLFRRSALSTLVLLAISAHHAQAAEPSGQFKYAIRATAQYEGIENPTRVNDSDATDELAQGRLGIQLSRATSRVSTQLDFQYNYLDYRKDMLLDREFTSGSGSIVYTPIRDTLSWELSHVRQMQSVDASLPTIMDNLQVVKTTQTGPTLQFNLGPKNLLTASYTYSKSSTTRGTIFKQDRGTATAQYKRLLTSTMNTGIVYNQFNTFSENTQAADYQREITSWNNQYNGEKIQATIDVGYVDSSSDLSSDYYNLDFSYTPVPDTTLSVSYLNSVEDLFSNLLYGRAGFPPVNANPGTAPLPVDPTPNGPPTLSSNLVQQYEVDRGTVTLAHQIFGSLNYSLQYSTEDRIFALHTNDQNNDWFGLIVSAPIGTSINLSLSARDADLYFRNNDRMQQRQEYTATGTWTINRSFSLQLSFYHMKQKGNTLLDTYDSSSAMIGFTYQIGN